MKTDTDTSSEELIAKVIDLDEGATEGKWRVYHKPLRPALSSARIIEVQATGYAPIVQWSGFDNCERAKVDHLANAKLIAYYRTAAPLLARRLSETMQALKDADARYDAVLSSISKEPPCMYGTNERVYIMSLIEAARARAKGEG